MIKPEGGRGFNSHPGQSFPLSLCGLNSISRANLSSVVAALPMRLFNSASRDRLSVMVDPR